jgi:hypothetical protein
LQDDYDSKHEIGANFFDLDDIEFWNAELLKHKFDYKKKTMTEGVPSWFGTREYASQESRISSGR